MTVVRHICWVKVTYRIEKRGRKWLFGVNTTPGQKPHKDKIAINAISQEWQVGQEIPFHAIHSDDISSFGHRVTLIPCTEEDYYAAPAAARF